MQPQYQQPQQHHHFLRGRVQGLPWRRTTVQSHHFTPRTMYQRRPIWSQSRQCQHQQQNHRRFGMFRGRPQQSHPDYGRSSNSLTDWQLRRRASIYGQHPGMSDLPDSFSRMSTKQQRRRSGFAGAPLMSMNSMHNRRRRRSGFYGGSLGRILPAAMLRGPFYILAPGNALLAENEYVPSQSMYSRQGYDLRTTGAESRGAGPPRQTPRPYDASAQYAPPSAIQPNRQVQVRPQLLSQPSAVQGLSSPQPARPALPSRPNTVASSVSASRPSPPPMPSVNTRLQRSKSMGDMRAKPPPADLPPLPPLPQHMSVPSNKSIAKSNAAGNGISQASSISAVSALPGRVMPEVLRRPPASDALRRPTDASAKGKASPGAPSHTKQSKLPPPKAPMPAAAAPSPLPTFELNKKIHYKPSAGSKDDSDTSSIYTAYWHESRPRVGGAFFNNKTEGIGIPKLGGSTVYVNKKSILKHPDEDKKPSAEGRGASAGSFHDEVKDTMFLRVPDFHHRDNGQTRLGSSY